MGEDSGILGNWVFTDARFDEDPNDTSLNLADELVDKLAEENCYLVAFTFNNDNTFSSTDKVNYVEINAGPTGLNVDCPEQQDSSSGTWSLSGNQLTLTETNKSPRTLTVKFEGELLVLEGEAIDSNNYAGADAIFSKL